MIDILRKFMPQFMRGRRVTTHLRGVLSKLLLCRTAMLDGRTWECPQCATRCQVYNSCTDRHCPQCMGARRATWLSKTSELLLPNVNYFQVVFTLPDLFSPLILGNRKLLYDLLFHTQVTDSPWNVFIEGPPHGNSDPSQVLKYLARYLTGGPISDRRVVQITAERVTFLARSKDKSAGNPLRECQLPGVEFVRRWAMHVLPKGYTRSRCYGGYHGAKRQAYLQLCRELLPLPLPRAGTPGTISPIALLAKPSRRHRV